MKLFTNKMAADMDMFVCSFVYPLQEAVEEIL